MIDWKMRPYLLEVNHSPSFTCDSPLDQIVKTSVLRQTMELVSFGKDEYKILKRCGTRIDPPTRDRLCRLREAYETEHCQGCGFDQICPPISSDPEHDASLLSRYQLYTAVAAQLYSDQSLRGSRRTTNGCGGACGTMLEQLREHMKLSPNQSLQV